MNAGTSFRRGWRANRTLFFFVSLFVAVGLVIASRTGVLRPLENVFATPLNAVSGFFQQLSVRFSLGLGDLAEFQTLQQRNVELEEALARLQSEVVDLREISNDYARLAELLDYTTQAQAQEFITADVIAVDQRSSLRSITVNRGTRDGIAPGMPVVTPQGLVGRVTEVGANAARVLLITDLSSFVSARLQTSRSEGTINGQVSGNLLMTFIPLGESATEGDIVLTSGLGGNFPPDLVVGQVTSVRTAELYQEAQVRSLINFDTLEIVLVMTNFQPIDLSIFGQADTGN
ncbi:MAG: rod shape-determining protein MreC [bacterium]|nr:rod shape-determining protein MreC [bacterium]